MKRIEGKIYTGLLSQPATDALLVGDDGTIRAIGDEARQAQANNVEVLSLGERVAVPGFIDAHVHLDLAAAFNENLPLFQARSLDEILQLISDYSRGVPEERVILGMYWNNLAWDTPVIPTRKDLDRVAPGHSVAIRRAPGQMWVCNSNLIARIRGRDGLKAEERKRLQEVEADGIFTTWTDIFMITPLLGGRTPEEELNSLRDVCAYCLNKGLTAVCDCGKDPEKYFQLDNGAKLDLQIIACMGHKIACRKDPPAPPDGYLQGRAVAPGAVKFHLENIREGSLGEGHPLVFSRGELAGIYAPLHKAGLQLAMHAETAEAVEQALDVLEDIQSHTYRPDHRYRIEHATCITDDQLERAARLGAVISVQPNFAALWQHPGSYYERELGDGWRKVNRYRDILDAGVPLAFGSDCMPADPMFGVYAAMNHAVEEQRLTFEEALHAYTGGSAFACRIEETRGSLEKGKQADIAVLSGDPAQIPDAVVEQTYVGGVPGT